LNIVVFVFVLRDIASIQGSGEVIAKLIRRTPALAAELDVLLIGIASVSFGEIRGNRYSCPAHLCAQTKSLFLWKMRAHFVDTRSKQARQFPRG
jgi:hypothetical protein